METNDPRLTFGRFLADVASRHSERTAIVFERRRVRYAELEEQARALARGLIGAGVVKGARVAVLMANRPEWIVSAFAVGMTGAVLVPVNTFASRDEFDYILRHSDASMLLMQPSLLKHRFVDELVEGHPEIADGVPGRIRCAALPQLRRVACLDLESPRRAVEPWSDLLAQGGTSPTPCSIP